MGFAYFLVLLMLLGFCFQAKVLNSQSLTCNSNDLRALEGFLNGLESGIDGWGSNSSSDCCSWDGVICEPSQSLGVENSTLPSNRVVRLELGRRRLKGKLSESLASLDQLRILNISNNFISGSLPIKLFHLQNLEVLDLSYNDIVGSIPVDANLPSIWFLDISENQFNGSIGAGICNNSTRIRVLNLSMNYFFGKFPAGFGNCSSLEHLFLNSNHLWGSLAEDLFWLQNLSRLNLGDNRLSGQLSMGIGNLSNLVQIDISLNAFSGFLPDVFMSFRKLESLSAHSNNFTGRLPVSLSNSPTIHMLNLRNNSMDGPIDLNCSAMVRLTSLHLGSNQFNGPIPDNLPLCRELKTVNLARINFSSQIPESFKNFQTLSCLSLSNSSLLNISAALGILQQCRNLTTLVLTMNFYEEEMPSDLTLQFESLEVLIIANCKLTGLIPPWLSNSTKLQLLDLSWNCLGGTIPFRFGSLEFLFYLDLSNNSLSGEIPRSLTELQSLIYRDILFEEHATDFPFFIKRNESGLQYNQIGSFPPTLDLSYNRLTGLIWPEFGNLKKLHVLDLQMNNLSGPIPSMLSGMTSLETLDLSHNNLSGTIPTSLVNLTFLSKFNVAYNHLSGSIPLEGQFRTFSNSSFEGNKGLCGEHSSPCPRDHIPFESHRKSKRNKDLEHLGSKLVVLFQNKENNKDLSIDDLLKSTNNFDQANIIGCGGFGLVYRATLPDGRKVAIKRLSGDCGQMEREFQAEVEALSRAQHGNLVLLQGYCSYKNDRILIYSYMENASLDYWLHEKIDGLPR
ncbi:hypothetical protein HHK36_031965 [Tetracentron sinense]|uniref:Protein kinase domain-containing protein n=1 Tax=Tetracentron sinense TaxID=13715 RepID=A0A835CY33_TETSI|nr:hypothetical protein HHK36_031965 [Tetracentron sinense]